LVSKYQKGGNSMIDFILMFLNLWQETTPILD